MFENVRVPRSNMLLGEGRGFEIAQGRLGPGRIHHCMRLIGAGRARTGEDVPARQVTRRRSASRWPSSTVTLERIAESRIMIDQARLLTLKAAYMMDTVGNKAGEDRDRDDQGRGARDGLPGPRLGDPGARRRRRLRRLRPRAGAMRTPGPCAWPTDPTKCIATRSASWSSPSTDRRDQPVRARRFALAGGFSNRVPRQRFAPQRQQRFARPPADRGRRSSGGNRRVSSSPGAYRAPGVNEDSAVVVFDRLPQFGSQPWLIQRAALPRTPASITRPSESSNSSVW